MKTSVTKMMMSLALMGCLIIGASDASAQGRSRSQGGSTSSRSQSTAVSRPSNQSTAPTVSRSSSTSSRTTSTSPQVNRSSSSSTRSMTTAPSSNSQVNRPSSTVTKPATTTKPSSTTTTTTRPSSTSRPSTGAVIRGGSSSGNSGNSGTPSTVTRRSDNIGSTVPKGTAVTSRERDVTTKDISTKKTTGSRPTEGSKPNGNLDKPTGNDRPSSGTTRPNGNSNVSGDKPNGKPNGGHGNRPGYDNNNHFDYANHHYANDFHTNFNNHNWSRPLPPPVRPYRPTPLVWYRPVIPAGWYPYAGAPVIDRILGLTFGTLFDTSLDYLYYNGYEIDGYADHIIYLRNVPLLNLIWDDVMLSYDSLDRLVNAQFVFQSTYSSRNRYDRVYRNLCRVYGQPVARTSEGISWYGGNSTGWVTLSMHNNLGHYYTTVSIGY